MTSQSFNATVSGADQPILDLSRAINPTPDTLAKRRNLPIQFSRFVAFMARMVVMVAKGHG